MGSNWSHTRAESGDARQAKTARRLGARQTATKPGRHRKTRDTDASSWNDTGWVVTFQRGCPSSPPAEMIRPPTADSELRARIRNGCGLAPSWLRTGTKLAPAPDPA